MTIKLMAKHHLEFLSFKGGYTGSSESTCQSATLLEITCKWTSSRKQSLRFLVLIAYMYAGSECSNAIKIISAVRIVHVLKWALQDLCVQLF